jgi:predicted small lipoprotein YifL
MQRLFSALIALVAITTLLAGCGQKGPLFLPPTSTPTAAEQVNSPARELAPSPPAPSAAASEPTRQSTEQ